ncbi:MAG: hypothetical protein QXG25_01515 [Nitrososphaerota archaeon]
MDAKENSSRDHTPYAIIVKPRKDLKIEYPYEVRMEKQSNNSNSDRQGEGQRIASEEKGGKIMK